MVTRLFLASLVPHIPQCHYFLSFSVNCFSLCFLVLGRLIYFHGFNCRVHLDNFQITPSPDLSPKLNISHYVQDTAHHVENFKCQTQNLLFSCEPSFSTVFLIAWFPRLEIWEISCSLILTIEALSTYCVIDLRPQLLLHPSLLSTAAAPCPAQALIPLHLDNCESPVRPPASSNTLGVWLPY